MGFLSSLLRFSSLLFSSPPYPTKASGLRRCIGLRLSLRVRHTRLVRSFPNYRTRERHKRAVGRENKSGKSLVPIKGNVLADAVNVQHIDVENAGGVFQRGDNGLLNVVLGTK